ncbi:hypothetical protein GE300_01360 [Rhodobacteraceae bacterium 2CG4]|uniref:Uncharacterized protein n=1 Tax=Halovulum marinum TaxID=2662447 RepID=A0A6L5YWL6_9RHOB|nr:hypothetical protein [Halovulum marinum]MSU88262.1 hypothetical protein [Halovulum marinum]
MTRTAILTAALLALAGTAGAQCFGDHKATTAQTEMTPVPTAEAEQPTDPLLLLQGAGKVSDEG